MTFVVLNWRERKSIASHRDVNQHSGEYTFEIPHSYSEFHTWQTKYIYIHKKEKEICWSI